MITAASRVDDDDELLTIVAVRVFASMTTEAVEMFWVTSAVGTKRTSSDVRSSVAIGGKADVARVSPNRRD
jgi:hypothetical protein